MINLNLDKKHKYLLACSFGPDSMALFHLLQKGGYNFECAIVNYHLRKESNLEVENLISYAARFGIKVHVYNVEQKIVKNIEATCREIRYQFFSDLTSEYGFDATLVAHHQDDLIETYLLQKQRQNNPIFYGICEKTTIKGITIIRPLLIYKKTDLLKICIDNNVPYSVDKTNFDIAIKRNKIRHEIVAKLDRFERRKILQQIDNDNRDLNTLFKTIDLNRLSDLEYILSLSARARSYAFNILAKRLDESLYLSKENVGQVVDILKSKKPNGQFKIKTGLYLLKEYSYFEFSQSLIKKNNYEYVIDKPCAFDSPYFYLDFTKDSRNRNVYKESYPIKIRNISLSDVILINGYKASAKRLLIDWKVPYRKRLIWPVILDKNNKCIYIPRYQPGFKPDSKCNFFVK